MPPANPVAAFLNAKEMLHVETTPVHYNQQNYASVSQLADDLCWFTSEPLYKVDFKS